MALLIDIGQPEWLDDSQLAQALAPLLPGVDIRCARDPGDPADITMIALARNRAGQFAAFPGLLAVQKLGAGVETIVADPSLAPGVRVARLKTDAPARDITDYCLAHVLSELQGLRRHHDNQRLARWAPAPPRASAEVQVGVLGLGHIGARVARTFAALGFAVAGFSRTAKAVDGVACHAGDAGLARVLGESDFVIAVLPSTPATRGLFDARRFAQMKDDAILVNVGRGDLVVDTDLVEALDAGRPGGAVLDVFATEPLPPDHPFWHHPKIRVTPHVSGWHLGDGLGTVAENYRRLFDGRPLLHEVDRRLGY